MLDQNIASEYYKEERRKNQKERPWLYWLILGVVAVIVMIVFALV